MSLRRGIGRSAVLLAIWVVPAASATLPATASAREGAQKRATPRQRIDPRADRLLHGMSDYLGNLKSFRVEGQSVDEVVLKSGQKIQFMAASEVSVMRPDHLRSQRIGRTPDNMTLLYNGKAFTILCNATSSWATAPAPGNLDAAIDQARSKWGIEAPAADLLFAKPYEVLTEDVTGGDYIGIETVDGVSCHHLAFRGNDVDFQIWIKDGQQPLPMRYVITSKNVTGQPEFSVRLSNWEPEAQLSEADFQFQPAAGAVESATFPPTCAPTAPTQSKPLQGTQR